MFIGLFRSWPRPTLGVQILTLLLGGLVVAQLVTVLLTLVLPPEPQPQYGLDDIASALAGAKAHSYPRPLERILQAGPPTVSGPGWLISERSQHDLAALLQRPDSDVVLYFYTPLPFAGTANAPIRESTLSDGKESVFQTAAASPDRPKRRVALAGYVLLAQAFPTSGGLAGDGGGMRGGTSGGGFPTGAFPGGNLPGGVQQGAGFPTGTLPNGGFPPSSRSGAPTARNPTEHRETQSGRSPTESAPGSATTGTANGDPSSLSEIQLSAPRRASETLGEIGPGTTGRPSAIGDSAVAGPQVRVPDATRALPGIGTPGRSAETGVVRSPAVPAPAPRSVRPPLQAGDRRLQPPANVVVTPALPPRAPVPAPSAAAPPSPAAKAPAAAAASSQPAKPTVLQPVTKRPPSAAPTEAMPIREPSLFGLGAAPFIQGDFIAALKLPDGRWSVVKPAPEPFPNSWQKRVLLWFGVSFAIVAPLGWMFAQRLAKPIAGFAHAAEQLGRDPHAPVLAIGGPAEVGRAAHAFNRMQSRLRSFVDDRTAMMGAISHDLRTPLTRMRFRLEDAPDDLREGMEQEVAEMEDMINSVLAFIRDASEPGARERLDLRTIVEDVVEDAAFIGGDVALEQCEPASVEVDVLGMRRLLGNLVENAVKYGSRARVRLFRDHNDAVAEIRDNGPGLPDDELERVFQPFYRSANAQASDKKGSGLGLAVCRSIARAHGGDVRLMRSPQGFVAQLRVPLIELSG